MVTPATVAELDAAGCLPPLPPALARSRHPRLAVVLTTGYSQALAEGNGHFGTEVLHKPYNLNNLAAALERAFAAVETDTQGGGPGQASTEE